MNKNTVTLWVSHLDLVYVIEQHTEYIFYSIIVVICTQLNLLITVDYCENYYCDHLGTGADLNQVTAILIAKESIDTKIIIKANWVLLGQCYYTTIWFVAGNILYF